jgi:hypothetical protein
MYLSRSVGCYSFFGRLKSLSLHEIEETGIPSPHTFVDTARAITYN